jgi:predicted alpha-1,6-mannanase (GH76 family)
MAGHLVTPCPPMSPALVVSSPVDDLDYRACAAAGVAALQRWYSRWTGQWQTTGWWNAANALTAIIDYTDVTGDRTYAWVIRHTFWAARLRHSHFVNRFFDDNGWWALAWTRAYDLTRDTRYLIAAQRIFDNMVTGWDETCRGGLWWNEDRQYKNAIPNELFLALATRLQLRSADGGQQYLDWARREWEWFDASGMVGAKGLVNDGLTPECANNGQPTYTYNQGVILAGLAGLYEITGDAAYLRRGESIASAALRDLTTASGILTEPGEAGMTGRTGDGSQFKGIFVRHLCEFHHHSPRPEYREFILQNARSIWDDDRNADNQFGVHWAGPFDSADASRQSSALDALNAAAAVTSPA